MMGKNSYMGKFPKQPDGSCKCGAYALAYWWSQQQPEGTMNEGVIRNQAEAFYEKVKFEESDFRADCDITRLGQYAGREEEIQSRVPGVKAMCIGDENQEAYCNPQKMMMLMGNTKREFYLGEVAEILAIYATLATINEKLRTKPVDFSSGITGIEVVAGFFGELHYLYIFDGYAVDPASGGVPCLRESIISEYDELHAGIVIG